MEGIVKDIDFKLLVHQTNSNEERDISAIRCHIPLASIFLQFTSHQTMEIHVSAEFFE